VYRGTSSSGNYSLLGSTSSTSYTDNGLSAGTTYYYKVSAYNSNGVESSQSSYASATTTSNVTTPAAPSGVTASAASSSSITVSWSSVSGATEYYVYRGTSAAGSYTYLMETTSTLYTNTGLSAGTTYYYKVSAGNSAGEGSQSSYASATTTSNVTTPSAPSGVTASAASSSSITVSWSSVSGATEYYVYRGTSATGSYTYLTETTSTLYTNTGLSAGTTYYYKVSAGNSAGEGSQSSSVYATTDAVVTPGVTGCGYYCLWWGTWGTACKELTPDLDGKASSCTEAIAICDRDAARYGNSSCTGAIVGGNEYCGSYCLWEDGCMPIRTDRNGDYGDVTTTCSMAELKCNEYGLGPYDNANCSGSSLCKSPALCKSLFTAPAASQSLTLRVSHSNGKVAVDWLAATKISGGTVELINSENVTVSSVVVTVRGKRVTAVIDAGSVPAGTYVVRVSVRDTAGQKIVEQTSIGIAK
jgi:fibronectin type 3 domain-containing protein